MPRPLPSSATPVRAAQAVLIAALAVVATATPAAAQHRARLSADLADHLAAGSQQIDVYLHGSSTTVDELARRYNLQVKRRLKSGAVLHVNAGQLDALSQDVSVEHLSGDIVIRPSDVTTQSIGVDQVWAGADDLPALTGAGISVAVLDSGIDPKHHALKKRVLVSVDTTAVGSRDGADRYGHGTHVAGIIAGQAGKTPDTSDYRGVASGAYLVNVRVLGDDGSGTVSSVIEGIDWTIEHSREFNIRVMNLSLGTPVLQPYRDDPLCEAVERAVRAGIVVVVSGGNNGKTADGRRIIGGILSPGNSPHAITVGALDTHETPQRSDDTVASYSSRGPTRYDLILKPDLVAPGSHVVSAEAGGSYLATTYSQRHVAGKGPHAYMQLSGTSMAAGVVSGAVAVLLEAKPRLTPRTAKAVLQVTSSFMPSEGLISGGAGSLNALAAAVLAVSGSVSGVAIGGEPVKPGGFTFTVNDSGIGGHTMVWGHTIVWGNTIVWGQHADTIIWGQAATIIWGQAHTIIWGQADTIIWGQADTIIWGQADTIIWGQADTIIWGQASFE